MDGPFRTRLEQYIAAGNASTLAAQFTWEELRVLGELTHALADLFDVARVQRAQLDEGALSLTELVFGKGVNR